MALRNFWADIYVDGRESPLGSGPRAKDGGMEIVIRQRDKGEGFKSFTISCTVDKDKLKTTIENDNGEIIGKCETER